MYKIEKVESLLYQLEALKNSPEGFIYEHFENIKRDVDLRRERIKQEVDKCSDQIIEQIDKTKLECLKISMKIDEISGDIENSTKELSQMKYKFDTLDTDAKPDILNIVKYNEELAQLERKIDEKLRNYKESILENKIYSFVFDEIDMENIFGKIVKSDIGEFYLMKSLEGSKGSVHRVSFNQKNLLATASNYGEIKIWNTDTWSIVKKIETNETEEILDIQALAFNQNNLLASSHEDNKIRFWNTETWSLVKTLKNQDYPSNFAFNKNNLVATGTICGKVQIWNTETWQLVINKNIRMMVTSIAFVQNDWVAIGTLEGGTLEGQIEIRDSKKLNVIKELDGNHEFISCLSFNQKDLLFAGTNLGIVQVWNTETWSLIAELGGHETMVFSIAFSQDCKLVATASGEKTIIWDTKKCGSVKEIEIKSEYENYSVAFNQDNYLATGVELGKIQIWHNKTGPLN